MHSKVYYKTIETKFNDVKLEVN